VNDDFVKRGLVVQDNEKLQQVLELVKERCTLLADFYDQSKFFFIAPENIDADSIKGKWSDAKTAFFKEWIAGLTDIEWNAAYIESSFKELAAAKNIKVGEWILPLRVMLVGGKFGP